jgi:hypothetical protein
MVYNFYMQNKIVENFLDKQELQTVREIFNSVLFDRVVIDNDNPKIVDLSVSMHQERLGRLMAKDYSAGDQKGSSLPDTVINKFYEYAQSLLGSESVLIPSGISFVSYSSKYGNPDLTAHVDGGSCVLILDYQLESTTNWPIGIGKDAYKLSDNSLIAFKALEQYHWRTKKKFLEDEYVNLIFFEYMDPSAKPVEDLAQLAIAQRARDDYQTLEQE